MNDLALAFFIPPEDNPKDDLPGKMPRGAVIFGVAAMAGLAIWAAMRSAAAATGADGVIGPPSGPPPTPGPGPVPPGPQPKPTQPKGVGQPVPPWADPNPYGYNVGPDAPYVAPDGLYIAPDCSGWKMGRQWFPQVAAPIIQQWINNGWTAAHPALVAEEPTKDVYIQIGAKWAWGWEVARELLKPYLEQSNPRPANLPAGEAWHCWDGFTWPWEYRDMFRHGELVLVNGDWQLQCPANHEPSPVGTGTTCIRTNMAQAIEDDRQTAASAYPGLFAENVGLIWLVWNVWTNLSYGLAWNDPPVQESLNNLQPGMA